MTSIIHTVKKVSGTTVPAIEFGGFCAENSK
jgi:hypothetical protein